MIIVDFSNLSMRMLFVSIEQAKKNGTARVFTDTNKLDVSCYKNFYLHLLFNNLASIKKEFTSKYGDEIVLAIDAKNTWRKEFYSGYKSKRKGDRDDALIEFDQYYKLVDNTIKTIDEGFPFKVVYCDGAEGDDIVAVLANNTSDKVLVVSEDKDFKQLLKSNRINLYKPIQKVFVQLNKKELISWRAQHIVGGDPGDSVPTIKTDTEFSLDFIKFLRLNEIFETDVLKFNSLSISTKLYEQYIGEVFKPARFGAKGVEAFAKNMRNSLKEKKIYWKNYMRNKKLVMFEYIPQSIQEEILKSYSEAKVNYNPLKIKSYFDINELRYLSNNVQQFYTTGEIKPTAGMFDIWS